MADEEMLDRIGDSPPRGSPERGNGDEAFSADELAQLPAGMQRMLGVLINAVTASNASSRELAEQVRRNHANGESIRGPSMPGVSKVVEFEGYESKLSPREWLAQARAKFPVAVTVAQMDTYVRRAASSFTGPALTLWLSFVAALEPDVSLTCDRLESFLTTHFGRLEAPEFILPQFDALTLDSVGSITAYVSRFQTLLARLGPGRSVADDVHRFLRGLPSTVANSLRLKFAGSQASVQAYIDALCSLPDREQASPRKATHADLGPKNGGVAKGKAKHVQTPGSGKPDGDSKPKGPKCWRCGQVGHYAKNCPSKVTPSSACKGQSRPGARLAGSKRSFAELDRGSPEALFTCSDAALASARDPDGCAPLVGKLTFVMSAGIQGRTGRVRCLLDSGATSCFISRRTVKRFGLRIVNVATRRIILPDGSEEETTELCSVPLCINGKRIDVPCLVANLEAHEIILGDTFLALTDADLSWRTKMAHFTIENARINVAMIDSPEPAFPTINAVEARKLLKKGGSGFAVVVSPDGISAVDVDEGEVVQLGDDPSGGDNPRVQAVVNEFADVFPAELPPGLPPDRNVSEMHLRGMYRLSPVEREEVTATLKQLLSKGFIEPSTSAYASPILFVRKKEGTLRMVVDYRGVNKITERNQYPLPRIDDLLDQLNGARVFSSLDLMSGYHQVRITPEDVPKTAFKTPEGLYQFRVLPFGLTNAPATFQKVMNDVLKPVIGKCALVYMDDILVYSRNAAEHEEHLRLVLQLLREHKLYCKLPKCSFFRSEVAFLGHLVSGEGVRADPRKVEAVRTWPTPLNVHDVRCFLGLTNYFRRFILGYSTIARPLMDLLKDRVPWAWAQVQEEAFRDLKLALTSAPVLQIPDFSRPFEVVADASGSAVGAILMQDGRPVAFESRVMNPAERNYPVGEQELLAVVHALTVWRCYLEGPKFTVVTDHSPNTYLPTMRNLSPRQARWSQFLQRFDFVWEYRPGRINCADPLSRRPSAVLNSIRDALRSASRSPKGGGESSPSLPVGESDEPSDSPSLGADAFSRLWTEGSSDLLARIRKASEGLTLDDVRLTGRLAGLVARDGVFWCDNRDGTKCVFVPDVPGLREEVVAACHDGAYAGHFGQRRTAKLVQRGFFWPSLYADVCRYVSSCDSCQRNKPLSGKPQGLLTPLPVAERPWDHISMDFVMALPKTLSGHDAVLVVVDRFSKMVKFIPTTNTVTAEVSARLCMDNVFKVFGMPKTIVSDRDPRFTGKFFVDLCKLMGIKQTFSSAYHPQTDG
jgi:hypothetical protein